MRDIVIRPATPADAPQIARLEQECFTHPWSEESVREELENENARFFAAERGGVIVAYGGMQTAADEGYILNVAVHKALRCRGLGRAVIGALTEEAKRQNLAFITLEMRETNMAAAALYTACGFEPVGRRRGYYTQPKEDAILMTLFFGERT